MAILGLKLGFGFDDAMAIYPFVMIGNGDSAQPFSDTFVYEGAAECFPCCLSRTHCRSGAFST